MTKFSTKPTLSAMAENQEKSISREAVKIGGYHIHSDAFADVSKEFERGARSLGFQDTSFTETAEGVEMFVPVGPKTMFSYFTDDKRDFNQKWRAFCALAKKTGFVGYMEGEYGEPRTIFPSKLHDPSIQFPFKITRRKIEGGSREPFRETEFHLELDYDASDPVLIQKLVDSGLYGALYHESEGYRSLVLTIQGSNREIIPIQAALTEYLFQAGGIEKGKIAKEDVREHAEFNIESERLPEVVDRVEFFHS